MGRAYEGVHTYATLFAARLGCGDLSGTVDFSSVADFEYINYPIFILYGINYSVIPLSNTILLLS